MSDLLLNDQFTMILTMIDLKQNRVDYMLQNSLLDLKQITAHNSYWNDRVHVGICV